MISSMKKNILLLLSIVFLAACSPRNKKGSQSVGLKGFTSYYNTIFNSKDALESELRNRDEAHQDNFYAPYIRLMTYDEQPLGTEFGQDPNSMFGNDMGGRAISSTGGNQQTGATTLQIAEAKALKAIAKYSVQKNGEEKNKMMFDAHILLAQSRLYQNKPLEALDALNYIFTNMRKDKDINLARIYQGLAYTRMKDYYRANEVFHALKNSDLKKDHEKLLTVYYSEMLLDSGKKEEAVAELEDAFSVNKNRKLRSRIAFLRGQILADLGKNEEARESFVTAYKNSNDFEFEVKSQVEIAKTFNGSGDDYEGAKNYLEDISKKGTYASRKNEFYYALGLMANKAGKPDEAQEYFRKSIEEKVSDPQIRGLTFYEVGKSYFDKNDYLSAGAYYDSALAVMTYEPSKRDLDVLSKNIKDVTANYYLIKKNDSILALTKMSEPEKTAYFAKYIEDLKAKEAKEEAERIKLEKEQAFDTGDYNPNSMFSSSGSTFQDFSGTGGGRSGFYFANDNTVSKGRSEFNQRWGSRALMDNWRFSNRMATLEDARNMAMGIETVRDPRRFEPSFYMETIPTNPEEIFSLKKDRDTASLGLGRMYDNYFSNRPLATKTLYDLVDNKPEDDIRLQALYQIFAMNYELNPSSSERAKNLILSDYPYTSYAEFVKNPRSSNFLKSSPEVEGAYKQAFDLYATEKFEDSNSLIVSTVEKYPKDALVPKFALLQAFNTGKTAGKEIMILQLEQIALNYSKTPEGEKAKEMLNYLKSDLSMDLTDESGNRVSTPAAPKTVPATVIQENPGQPRLAVPSDPDEPDVEEIQRMQMQKLREIDEQNMLQNRKELQSPQSKN